MISVPVLARTDTVSWIMLICSGAIFAAVVQVTSEPKAKHVQSGPEAETKAKPSGSESSTVMALVDEAPPSLYPQQVGGVLFDSQVAV